MRTPWRAYSSAADLVNAINPALAAAYKAHCGTPHRPLTEEVLTIAPPRGSCASIWRISCCRHRQKLFRLSDAIKLRFGKSGSWHERLFHGRSIVKSAIQAAPAVHRGLHQPMDIGGLGDVAPDKQRPCAAGFDLACHTVAAFGTASSDDHPSPFPGERQRGGAADPRTSTGDQDNLIFHLTNVRQGAVASPTAATATTESDGLANPSRQHASLDWPIGATPQTHAQQYYSTTV